LRGAEGAPASTREFVDYAQHQRELWPDDGQVGLDAVSQLNHGVEASYIDGETLGFFGYASVARGAVDFAGARGLA
jgi:hypothetical protein